MKLPDVAKLNEAQKLLYEHDIKEYHARSGDLTAESYRRRFWLMYNTMVGILSPGARILDIGVAQGNLSLLLAEAGFEVVAIDLRSEFLEYARKKYEKGTIFFQTMSFEDMQFQEEFDAVILGEIIEHVAYPEDLLQRCRLSLKAEGLLLLSTPNGQAVMSRLPTFSQITDRKELEKHQFKPDGDGHLFLFRGSELDRVLRESGFEPFQTIYLRSPFLSGKFKVRYLARLLPWPVVDLLDKAIIALPGIKKLFSAGLVCLARKR